MQPPGLLSQQLNARRPTARHLPPTEGYSVAGRGQLATPGATSSKHRALPKGHRFHRLDHCAGAGSPLDADHPGT